MLRYLNIQNLAVIESLEVSFDPGLNVVTGETGAGKSIVVGAVGLLLGDRASSDLVRTGEETAIIQAVFEHEGRELIVRREVSAQGRSRSFIDGVLVTAGALKDLGAVLVDLHGQHEHQALLDPDIHVDLLDQFAGLQSERQAVAEAFGCWQEATNALEELRRQERDKDARADFLQFQLAEIERVRPQRGEDEELAAARHVLVNRERVRRLCDEAYERLYEGDGAVMGMLAGIWKRMEELAEIDARAQPYVAMRENVAVHLDEVATFLREYGARIEAAPDRLQEIEDRLAAIERLKRRYGPHLEDVLQREEAARAELAALQSAGERIRELEATVADAARRYMECAGTLSRLRQKAAPALAGALWYATAPEIVLTSGCAGVGGIYYVSLAKCVG
jgi:DNA repair protein RecN (Recombination protein N)